MGPLLFAPYAEHVAKRVALFRPERILETAAGTGIATRAVNEALPRAKIVATDINPAVVAFAARRFQSARVTFQAADAQQLPFEDESFDLVLCLFGIMFFPDKVRANAEARRVLRAGGRYVLVTFDRGHVRTVEPADVVDPEEAAFEEVRVSASARFTHQVKFQEQLVEDVRGSAARRPCAFLGVPLGTRCRIVMLRAPRNIPATHAKTFATHYMVSQTD